ncbi:hypothetical protein [Planctomicrobium sp. SH527]|uniref:hypothetical protein n=1 Tax=Planctomicrobium sp. SH527 TaxID=3448123 RepID=UPI003F5B15D0
MIIDTSFALLADGDFGFLIFFVVAFFSWLFNYLKTKAEDPQGNAKKAEQSKRVSNEIDKFLQQKREGPNNGGRPNQRRAPQGDVVVVEMPDSRQNPQQTRRQPPPSREEIWREQAGKQQRKQGKQQRGNGERRGGKQQTQQPSPPVTKQSSIFNDQNQDLKPIAPMPGAGNFASTQPVSQASHTTVESRPLSGLLASTRQIISNDTLNSNASPAVILATRLRNRGELKNAFVINEIFSKPLGLRK